MKPFGTDISRKFISFKTEDGEVYSLSFDYSLIKGITNVRYSKAVTSLETDKNGNPDYKKGFFAKSMEIEVIDTYPPLKKLFKEIWLICNVEFSHFKKKIKKRKSSVSTDKIR